jgi:hypothetical protein
MSMGISNKVSLYSHIVALCQIKPCLAPIHPLRDERGQICPLLRLRGVVRRQAEALPGEQLGEGRGPEFRDALDEEPALSLRATLQAFQRAER